MNKQELIKYIEARSHMGLHLQVERLLEHYAIVPIDLINDLHHLSTLGFDITDEMDRLQSHAGGQ